MQEIWTVLGLALLPAVENLAGGLISVELNRFAVAVDEPRCSPRRATLLFDPCGSNNSVARR